MFRLEGGEALQLNFDLVDDVELSQLKIDIHQNFECHGHSQKTEDWSFLTIKELSEPKQKLEQSIEVPSNVTAGNYHLGIHLVDNAGNEAQGRFMNIKVVNKSDNIAPKLTLISPLEMVNMKADETITFDGKVEDNTPLKEGGNAKVEIGLVDLTSGNYRELGVETFNEEEGSSVEFQFQYTVPKTLVKGEYEFVFVAFDGVNNKSRQKRLKAILE